MVIWPALSTYEADEAYEVDRSEHIARQDLVMGGFNVYDLEIVRDDNAQRSISCGCSLMCSIHVSGLGSESRVYSMVLRWEVRS